jgi:hypothetical protein
VLALLVVVRACPQNIHSSSPAVKSRRQHHVASVFTVIVGGIIIVAAATGNLDEDVGNSTGTRIGVGALGVALVGIGVYLWASAPAATPNGPPPGVPAPAPP